MIVRNSKPLVSIVMNCYNGEKYLHTALKSIINQTYDNWELIFWDVSTSVKCKSILQSFNEKKFKYFSSGKKKNLYNSRNEAIEKSNGEIISFLDCDDWWEPSKLAKQISYFQDDTVSIVYSNYFEHNQKSKKIKTVKKIKFIQDLFKKK